MASTTARNAPRIWVWLAWAVVLLVADQITKTLILDNYRLGDSTVITSFFNIVRAHNTGAAFSFLANAGGWQNSSAESRLTCRVRGGSQTWIIWFPPFFFSMHPAYRTGGENRRETGPLFLFYRSSVTSSLST